MKHLASGNRTSNDFWDTHRIVTPDSTLSEARSHLRGVQDGVLIDSWQEWLHRQHFSLLSICVDITKPEGERQAATRLVGLLKGWADGSG